MLKASFYFFLLLSFTSLFAQEKNITTTRQKFAVSDSIKIDRGALNKSRIKLFDSRNQLISDSIYTLNYDNGAIIFKNTLIKTEEGRLRDTSKLLFK